MLPIPPYLTRLAILLVLVAACASPLKRESILLRVAVEKEPLQVLEIELENYLLGVLAGEVPEDWPIEALKAQAVAARTYALYRRSNPRSELYDLETTVEDQVFKNPSKGHPSPKVSKRFRQAVAETAGEVLTSGEMPTPEAGLIPAYYHSCCGGQTEAASSVWGGLDSGLPAPIKDPYCKACPNFSWEERIPKAEITPLLFETEGEEGKETMTLTIQNRDPAGRVQQLSIRQNGKSRLITANDFRRTVGYQRLKSSWFDFKEEEEAYIFSGHGSGHGVGLCQWGAKGMAERGFPYSEILKFYYPQAVIQPWQRAPVDFE
ncbi:MAG: SpoIID/LytB domain-containing protein [Deltaproteobacteria bacterium]|nr:SpoIID/LytB domain-containing protein [Deltaproteobacteria bacterium]